MNKSKSRIYEQSPSRIDPSTIAKQQFQVQISQMRQQSFKPFNIPKCQTHFLPKQLICINQSCTSSNQMFCNQCAHCSHPKVSINKIVPLTCQWLFQQNSQIQAQNKKLVDQWNVVSQNITYCIEIFQQLLKIIQNHLQKKIYAPKKFIDITNIVYGMWTKDSLNQTPQMTMKVCNQLQKKYKLFDLSKEKQNLKQKRQASQKSHDHFTWQNIKCPDLEHEKKQRLTHALKANKKSKEFSEHALAFSQSLAELIQSKIKEQEHKIKIKEIKIRNELCLRDLIAKFNQTSSAKEQQKSKIQEMLQNVETFTMEFTGKQTSLALGDQKALENQLSQIGKLKNLKQLKINNKNGKIQHNMWYHILNYVEMLKFLKDLKLTLTQRDVYMLAGLFKQKEKAVRQIQSLTLQITDQKDLDLTKVNEFLNTLQLRKLHLNLSRNGLEFKKVYEFIRKLKIYTSLSQLPLIECKIVLTANKIHPDEKIQLEALFKQVCKDVKISQLTL